MTITRRDFNLKIRYIDGTSQAVVNLERFWIRAIVEDDTYPGFVGVWERWLYPVHVERARARYLAIHGVEGTNKQVFGLILKVAANKAHNKLVELATAAQPVDPVVSDDPVTDNLAVIDETETTTDDENFGYFPESVQENVSVSDTITI